MDSSLVYGFNKMEFTIENTLNRSLGAASKTAFDAGGFDYDQLVLNFSGVRQYEVGALASPLNVAAGIEARTRELLDLRRASPTPTATAACCCRTAIATASGAQVFPGFQPDNEVDEDRTAVGAYVDLEANLTERFLGSVALRVEDYSDFGSNLSGKLAGATTSPSRSPCAARCRTASARRRCSSSTSRPPRPTSSTACRSTSRPSR